MNFFRLITLSIVILMTGCASNPMLIKKNQTISQADVEKSQIVFMRSSFVGSAISSSLYDVTSGTPEFIGVLANGTKIAHNTTPGKHVYMVVSEAADFMEANVLAGKTYYSLVTPRMGFWKARFSLWPIKKDTKAEHHLHSKEFKKLMKNTQLVENSEKSKNWFVKNEKSIKSKYAKYKSVWKEKSKEDLNKRTLFPEDGQ